MANLKEVRTRIESVNSTKQITSAMKMVAASKLRKSQNAIMALRPYAEKFSEILERINGRDVTPVASEISESHKVLIIPLSSNKGLCGVFNANVIRETINPSKTNIRHYLIIIALIFYVSALRSRKLLSSRNILSSAMRMSCWMT